MAGKERHVLGLSGGRDSAALAVYMRQNHPELEVDYFFTDTGKELPEVYEFLVKLEGFLGRTITRLNPDRDFDFWLKQYNNFLPSPQTRWCTRQLKLRPFEQWIRPSLAEGDTVYSYVAIRADEEYREGYSSKHENLVVRLPLKAAGLDKAGVLDILEGAGLGLPEYYEWRTRSGCTFCFFQQKIEWVRLMERHPRFFRGSEKLREERYRPRFSLYLEPRASRWSNWRALSAWRRSLTSTSIGWSGCGANVNLTHCGRMRNPSTLTTCTGKPKFAWPVTSDF